MSTHFEFVTRSGVGIMKTSLATVWTPELLQAVIDMTKLGYRREKIGKRLGVTPSSVREVMRRRKLDRPRSAASQIRWADIERHNAGETNPAVLSRFVSIKTGYPWTAETIGQLVELRAKNVSYPEIHRIIGADKNAQSGAVSAYGLPFRASTVAKAPDKIVQPGAVAVKGPRTQSDAVKTFMTRKPAPDTDRRVKLVETMRRCLTCFSNGKPDPWFKSAHAGVRMCTDHRAMSAGMD